MGCFTLRIQFGFGFLVDHDRVGNTLDSLTDVKLCVLAFLALMAIAMVGVAGSYSSAESKSRISNGVLFEKLLADRDILTDCDRLNLLEPRDLRYGRDLLKISDPLDRMNLLYGRNLLDVSDSDRLYLSDLLDSDLTDISGRFDSRAGLGLLDFLDFLGDRNDFESLLVGFLESLDDCDVARSEAAMLPFSNVGVAELKTY